MNDQTPSIADRSDQEILGVILSHSFEEDGHEYWSFVGILQNRMTASLLHKMRMLILQKDEGQRKVAADVLAQGRAKDKEFSEECVKFLLDAMMHEESPKVLSAICNALGHHRAANAVGALATLQDHPDASVRLAVVHGLSCLENPVAIAALISLSADSDRDVRDWATFGLGSLTEVDSVQLREALLARMTDNDEEISGEAMVGLAVRGDVRVAEPLLKVINSIHESQLEYGSLIIEAVEAVRATASKHPNEAWHPFLNRCYELGLVKLSN